MKVKSLDELKKIREESLEKVNLREKGDVKGDKVEILVGMSTCGISSGARETLTEFIEEIDKSKINNIKVVPVGCIGYCHSEPTVQVNIPGQKPILYGNVKKDKVHEIFEKHLQNGEVVENMVLDIDFERA
ncbi:(2Fe-2S) ferredoxin domain-containing protein [Sporosalibacterium faouarense]|uniref:(2Fe-2S) ferredoxin domain-containing protein n=1 Tax=Sporosalibacterium faouarense TaxID=516123 RepID=UPI00141CB3C4|nr:(2Fe-2S) ferredoxin domain-containing protein [Sporosalibacterium faouarense]MTI47623.1 (2Fe-2S) ferredoxin domain-containing protein [Bacillota bacterium]